MRCPNDNSDLVVTDLQGVDVRTCPTCQGIWLGQGQLDRIIDQFIASQYSTGLDDLDDLGVLDEGPRRSRRRDKYTDDLGDLERPRKNRRRRNRREVYDEMLEF